MKKRPFFSFLGMLLLPMTAQAVNVTSDCRFTWNAPTTGGPVEGYFLYVEQEDPYSLANYDAGLNLEYACSQANLGAGRHVAWFTAYNVVGESEKSNIVTFDIIIERPGRPLAAAIMENVSTINLPEP